MTNLLQCLRDELVRRDYAASTIRSYIQIVEARTPSGLVTVEDRSFAFLGSTDQAVCDLMRS